MPSVRCGPLGFVATIWAYIPEHILMFYTMSFQESFLFEGLRTFGAYILFVQMSFNMSVQIPGVLVGTCTIT